MTNILKWLKVRLIDHWQTTITGVLIFIGFIWFKKGKIEFSEFTTYIALVPTIILMLIKSNGSKQVS